VVKTFLIVHARGRVPLGASIMANAVCENGRQRVPVDSGLPLVFPDAAGDTRLPLFKRTNGLAKEIGNRAMNAH
jgi:hypothetical protein